MGMKLAGASLWVNCIWGEQARLGPWQESYNYDSIQGKPVQLSLHSYIGWQVGYHHLCQMLLTSAASI